MKPFIGKGQHMKKVAWLAVIGLAVLGLGSSPARADLFGFTISNPETTFDGSSAFEVSTWAEWDAEQEIWLGTKGDLYRNVPPAGAADFAVGNWNGGDFAMSMTISDITTTTAKGLGTFTYTDVDGDILTGTVSGTWVKAGKGGVFNGGLSDVTFDSDTFDGATGSVSMEFSSDQPWAGTMIQVTSTGSWFASGTRYDVKGGSIDTLVTPVPAALLIGLLGLGTAGLKLRRFA